jgi:hypothetical protein
MEYQKRLHPLRQSREAWSDDHRDANGEYRQSTDKCSGASSYRPKGGGLQTADRKTQRRF